MPKSRFQTFGTYVISLMHPTYFPYQTKDEWGLNSSPLIPLFSLKEHQFYCKISLECILFFGQKMMAFLQLFLIMLSLQIHLLAHAIFLLRTSPFFESNCYKRRVFNIKVSLAAGFAPIILSKVKIERFLGSISLNNVRVWLIYCVSFHSNTFVYKP